MSKKSNLTKVLIIPAFNEAPVIADVIRSVPGDIFSKIIVVDNGSTDNTAQQAKIAGAEVVHEPRRGYGSACLAGIKELNDEDVVVFMDGDSSDDPKDIRRILTPIEKNQAEFVIGARVSSLREKGSMTPPQVFGNWLATFLIDKLWRKKYYDLGPLRAIRTQSLRRLNMSDTDYGWTVEMQIKAILSNLRTKEIPVKYRQRVGVSKISGTVRGVIGAGTKIIYTIGKYWLRDKVNHNTMVLYSPVAHDGND